MQEILDVLQKNSNSLIDIMDIMQYQDIHRQKIERVINISRTLINYLNELFSANIDDAKRVTSAVHIHGDQTTQSIVDKHEIEALLAQFASKK